MSCGVRPQKFKMPYYKNEGCYRTENFQKETYLGCSINIESWKLGGSAILHLRTLMTSRENKEFWTVDRCLKHAWPSISRYYRPIWRPTCDRHIDRYSADMSAETRSSVGCHVVLVNRPSVDTISRYVGLHSADTSADMLRSTVANVSVDCGWCIGRLLTVVLLK